MAKLNKVTLKKAMGFLFIAIMLTILLKYNNQIEKQIPKNLPANDPKVKEYRSAQNGIKIAGLFITVGGIVYVVKMKK